MFEKKIEALLISKRLITNSPRITDQNRCKFHSAALNAFKRSKSALNSLKSDFTVFKRKPSMNGCFLVCYTAVFFFPKNGL